MSGCPCRPRASILWATGPKIWHPQAGICAVPSTWQGDSFCTRNAPQLQLQKLCTAISPQCCHCYIFQLSKGRWIGRKKVSGRVETIDYCMVTLWNIINNVHYIECQCTTSICWMLCISNYDCNDLKGWELSLLTEYRPILLVYSMINQILQNILQEETGTVSGSY